MILLNMDKNGTHQPTRVRFSILAAIFINVAIGYLSSDNDFAPALVFIATPGILGALCYIFLVGKVERIEIKNVNAEAGGYTPV